MLFYESSRKNHAMWKRVVSVTIWAMFLIDPIQIAWSETNKAPHHAAPSSDSTKAAPPQSSPAPVPVPAPVPAPTPPSTANDTDKNPSSKSSSNTDGIPAIVVDNLQAQGIMGTQVRSSAGEDMGRIVDVIVDKQAQARGVVIDFGGFLGVGNRQIAVAWNAIRFAPQDKDEILIVDFTRDQLRAAPAYKSGEQIVLLGPLNNNANTTSNSAPAAGDAPKKQSPPQ